MDISQRNDANLQTSLFGETNDPTNTLENPWWIDPENMNIPALFAHWGWKALSVSGRVSGSPRHVLLVTHWPQRRVEPDHGPGAGEG
jgi:hypothetical protein